jgi:hypothetical protein
MRGDRVEQLLRDLIRIGVKEANPLFGRRLDLRQTRQQQGQAILQAEVLAVAGGVLPDQVNLADTLPEQARGFGNDGLEAAAAERAAILRNDAEGAGMVAALGDFDIGKMFRRSQNARSEVVIKIQAIRRGGRSLGAFDQIGDALQLVDADDGVHLRQLLPDVAVEALHQAAGDDQLLRAAHLFVLGHLEDGIDRFFLGGIDKTARVYDQDVGLIRMRRQLVPAGGKLPHHYFAVDKIFGTAQTDKSDFQGCGSSKKCSLRSVLFKDSTRVAAHRMHNR